MPVVLVAVLALIVTLFLPVERAWASLVSAPHSTVLTVHDAEDGVDAPALCMDNSLAVTTSPSFNFAVCLQMGGPGVQSQFRFGYLNLNRYRNPTSGLTDGLQFHAWTGWLTAMSPSELDKSLLPISRLTCNGTSANEFLGYGPILLSNNDQWHFGERFTQGLPAPFAEGAGWHDITGNCQNYSGTHALPMKPDGSAPAEWTTLYPKTCQGDPNTEWTVAPDGGGSTGGPSALNQALSGATNTKHTVCVTPGTYVLSDHNVNLSNNNLTGSTRLTVIGTDPIQSPVIDASGLQRTLVNSRYSSAIVAGNSTGVDLYNLVVENAPRYPKATYGTRDTGSGYGILAGTDFGIYNVFAANNAVNGVNGGSFAIQNSGLINNGDIYDNGSNNTEDVASAGGAKSNFAFTATWNDVDGSTGVGLWCDVGCVTTTLYPQWDVENNFVGNSTSGGIRDEIANATSTASIYDNVVEDNASAPPNSPTVHADIEVVDSAGADAEFNTTSDAQPATTNTQAYVVATDSRPFASPPKGVNSDNDTFVHNNLFGSDVQPNCTAHVPQPPDPNAPTNITCSPNP